MASDSEIAPIIQPRAGRSSSDHGDEHDVGAVSMETVLIVPELVTLAFTPEEFAKRVEDVMHAKTVRDSEARNKAAADRAKEKTQQAMDTLARQERQRLAVANGARDVNDTFFLEGYARWWVNNGRPVDDGSCRSCCQLCIVQECGTCTVLGFIVLVWVALFVIPIVIAAVTESGDAIVFAVLWDLGVIACTCAVAAHAEEKEKAKHRPSGDRQASTWGF